MMEQKSEHYWRGYWAYPNRHNYPITAQAETEWLKGWHDKRAEMTVDYGPDHVSEGTGDVIWGYLEE